MTDWFGYMIKIQGHNALMKVLTAFLPTGSHCLIFKNPWLTFRNTKKTQIMKFYDILKKKNINVTIRKEFGSKVDAACGQLRANQRGG